MSVEALFDGRIGRIKFGDGRLNIINLELINKFRQVLKRQKSQVLIIEGRGKIFSAGVDIKEHVPDKIEKTLSAFHSLLFDIMEYKSITISLLRGYALGGGLELAMAADFTIARKNTVIGFPEINIGAYPPFAAAYLPFIVPAKFANELIFSGRSISAGHGQKLGLINKVIQTEKDAKLFIKPILSMSNPALILAKKAMHGSQINRVKKMVRKSERIYLKELMRCKDPIEGVSAFLEKRKPVWTNS